MSFGKKVFKDFIDYKDAEKIRPLSIFLPKISGYRKDFDETKYISFLVKILLVKYNEIWGKKVKSVIKKDLMVNQYIMKNI